jgi:hypothetical protein
MAGAAAIRAAAASRVFIISRFRVSVDGLAEAK